MPNSDRTNEEVHDPGHFGPNFIDFEPGTPCDIRRSPIEMVLCEPRRTEIQNVEQRPENTIWTHVLQQDDPAAGLNNAAQFAEGKPGFRDRTENQGGESSIEFAFAERQILSICIYEYIGSHFWFRCSYHLDRKLGRDGATALGIEFEVCSGTRTELEDRSVFGK